MLCPLCQTQNRDNAKFCKGCGQPLAVEVVASAQPETTASSDQVQQGQIQELPPSVPAPEESAPPDTVPDPQGVFDPASLPSDQEAGQSEESSYVPTPDVPEREVPSQATAFQRSQHEQATGTPDEHDEHKGGDEGDEDGPTQILTPQQMLAFQARRWQQDIEREQQGQQPYYNDIAEAPTLLMTPGGQLIDPIQASEHPALSAEQRQPVADISEQATFVPASESTTTPATELAHSVPVSDSSVPSEQASTASHSDESVGSQQEDVPTVAAEMDAPAQDQMALQQDTEEAVQAETSAPAIEEEHVEPTPENDETIIPTPSDPYTNPSDPYTNTNGQSEAEVAGSETEPTVEAESSSGAFPVLEIGTTIGDRYEVTQVLNAAELEHIYEVADRKGYLHCWNCGSKENAEGDEFCIDCGAELLNASYLLHEYTQSGSHEGDAQVLHGAIVNTFVEQKNTYVVEQPMAAQSSFPNGVHLVAASDSDAGNVRRAETNEDSTLVLQFERIHESISAPVGLYVIADGMGGHANGQGASRTTIGLIAERVMSELLQPPLKAEKGAKPIPTFDDESLKELLRGAIEEANTTLCQVNQQEKSDMGSTLTGFMVVGDRAYIFNVGDSRTYMLRDEKLYQLTNDHSLVGQLVAGGLIEPEDVYTHPQRNQIFRSIGDKQNVQVDLFTQQVHPGDILISCSDGLWEMVRDPQIADILNQASDPQAACAQLIETANANGGEDNVSAVIVFVR